MSNIIEYKGYQAKVEFDAESRILYGKIEGIRDLVNFEAERAEEVEEFFHEAVNDYLDFCKEVGKSPDKAYNGQFNVRISPKLHRQLAMRAFRDGETLNKEVQNAIEHYLDEEHQSQKQNYIILHANSFETGSYNAKKAIFDRLATTNLWVNEQRAHA